LTHKLVGTDGTHFYSWPLREGRYILGRSAQCEFHIPDKTVSRQHVGLEVADDNNTFHIVDLGSRNGTAVNGNRITERTQVGVNDVIMVGQVELKIVPESSHDTTATRPSSSATIINQEPEKSVVMPMNEALRPLPSKITDLPEVLPTLFEMAKMLVLPESEQVLLERSLHLVAKVIPAQRLAVLFVSSDGNEVHPAATLLTDSDETEGFTLSRTIVNEVITNKNSVLIGDPGLDSRFSGQESIIRSALKSAMAVPLTDEGEVLGIVYVDTTNPMHRYNDDYLRLLATFSNIIASRLVNNSLLQERQEKEVMEAELQRAAEIQRQLLSPDTPQLERYKTFAFQQPSRQVGGDLYDIALLEDGHLLILVADVSGKGMGAALLMSNILAAFRILYHSGELNLLKSVEQVNAQLCKYSRSGDFATLFVGVLDPNSNELTFVNAGHNSPLLVRSDGKIEYLEASGVMIGAFDFVGWKEQKVGFNASDLLYIFTDGVTEAEATDGGMYSDERTEKMVMENRALSPKELADTIVADIRDFVQDAPSSDDITMMIIKRES
jgi:sigma-B regulation protein RsbU (phosphoserine phosphatase)